MTTFINRRSLQREPRWLILHALAAFVSGVFIESLYALGVIFISERRAYVAGLLSVAWGVGVLVGVSESFKSRWAAGAWCVGLGVGTVIGVWLKP